MLPTLSCLSLRSECPDSFCDSRSCETQNHTKPVIKEQSTNEGSEIDKKARAVWVDVARLIATVMIVVYHMPTSRFSSSAAPVWIQELLNYTSMPSSALLVFFFISGYFSPPSMKWAKISTRIIALMLPYLVYNSLYAIIDSQDFSISRVYGIGRGGCLDYPLWYVYALACLIFFVSVARKYIVVLLMACAVCVAYGNEWPWKINEYMPFATPVQSLAFLLGSWMSRISVQRMGDALMYGFPLWLAGLFFTDNETLSASCVMCLLFALSRLLECYWSGAALKMALFSRASFVCFALHAGLIVLFSQLAQLVDSSLLENRVLYGFIPFAICILSWWVYVCMNRYTPILLPLLAYSGRPGWLVKLEKRLAGNR